MHSIVNLNLEACPNHAINGLDSKIVARMSDEIVLSNRFDIMLGNPNVSSDVDSQCLFSFQGLSRDDLKRLSEMSPSLHQQ